MSKDKKNIEDFVADNRAAFDTEFPSLDLWAKIDQDLHPPTSKSPFRFSSHIGRWAAGILFLLGVGLTYTLWPTTEQQQASYTNTSPSAIAEQHPEMADIHEFFNHKINKRKGQLASMNHHDPELYRDLKNLESHFDTLYKAWMNNAHKSDEEKLINAMIANYQHRYQLLDRVVNQLTTEQHALPASQRHTNSTKDIQPAYYPSSTNSAPRPKNNQSPYQYYSYEKPYHYVSDAPHPSPEHLGYHR